MLKSLRIQNFRGFTDHTIEFSPFTLLTGQNNAGKTTIIEALRIIALARSKVYNAKFRNAPDEFIQYFSGPIYQFNLKTLDFDEDNIHHNYRFETPAILIAKYTNNASIAVFLGRDPADRYCQLQESARKKVLSRAVGSGAKFHKIFVMPPVGSLLKNETERDRRYLRENINGYLSYRHIRNQMFDMPEEFSRFTEKLESTWDHLHVEELLGHQGELRNEYHLNLRDGRYPAEVGCMGSGLQAWIQTLWFLSRVSDNSIIVLDEPDVYLHADLQKKLVRILGDSEFRQTIIATHSIEMISDASPDEIVDVRKKEDRSLPISATAEAQAILYQMGTSHHLQLSKLGKTGKLLFLEGKDHQLLGLVATKMAGTASTIFESVPRFAIGGMSNWKKAAMTAEVMSTTSGGGVRSTLLIDRDYFPDTYMFDLVDQAKASKLNVIHWRRKEIENYFLDPDAIWEYVERNSTKKIDKFDIIDLVDRIIRELMLDLPGQIAQNFQLAEKKLSIPTALGRANEFIAERKKSGATDLDLVSGKQAFSKLSGACQQNYGVSFSATTICRVMRLNSVPTEVVGVIEAICADN